MKPTRIVALIVLATLTISVPAYGQGHIELEGDRQR